MFSGHLSLQLVDLRREHQVNSFMGCDYNIELVCKRMKQLLRLHQIRSTHRTSVEATVRALLVAWALQEGAMAEIRPLLPRGAPEAPTPASSWLLTGLSLDT